MKTLNKTALILAALLSPGPALSDRVMETPRNYVEAKTFCLLGYVFAVAAHGGDRDAGRGVSVVQVYRPGAADNRPPQPLRCER